MMSPAQGVVWMAHELIENPRPAVASWRAEHPDAWGGLTDFLTQAHCVKAKAWETEFGCKPPRKTLCQSINQSSNQSKPINQPVNQSIKPFDRSINQFISQSINQQATNERTTTTNAIKPSTKHIRTSSRQTAPPAPVCQNCACGAPC